jgi:hypothetical protein
MRFSQMELEITDIAMPDVKVASKSIAPEERSVLPL